MYVSALMLSLLTNHCLIFFVINKNIKTISSIKNHFEFERGKHNKRGIILIPQSDVNQYVVMSPRMPRGAKCHSLM